MANNSNTPTGFTTEKDPSASAPVWTVPADSTSISDKAMLLPNNDQGLPSYNELNAPSAPEIGDLPPDYFDISTVPNGAILYYNAATPYTEASKAEIERSVKGVLSFDPLIDRNPDQLWLYFMTYLNEKPQHTIRLYGYYTEYYWTTETYTDSQGNTQTRSVQQSRDVTDFNFSFDLTPYICQQWWRVAVIPSKKTINAGEIVSLRDALEQYTLSNKSIKEIVCQKQLLGWNHAYLENRLTALIRSTGYQNNISITFSVSNDRIAARSSSKMSRFANSFWVRLLCVLTCLFLIFGPIYLCLRSMGSARDKIVADYTMIRPAETFYQLNAGTIVNAVISRSHGSYTAYIA